MYSSPQSSAPPPPQERTNTCLPGTDDVIVAQQVSGVAESVGGQVDLLPAQGPGSRQGLHQPAELERVKAVPYRKQGRKETFRVLRKTIHVGKIARLVNLHAAAATVCAVCRWAAGGRLRMNTDGTNELSQGLAATSHVFLARCSATASSQEQESLHTRFQSNGRWVFNEAGGYSCLDMPLPTSDVRTSLFELAPLICTHEKSPLRLGQATAERGHKCSGLSRLLPSPTLEVCHRTVFVLLWYSMYTRSTESQHTRYTTAQFENSSTALWSTHTTQQVVLLYTTLGFRTRRVSTPAGVGGESRKERKTLSPTTDLENVGLLQRGLHVSLEFFASCLKNLPVHEIGDDQVTVWLRNPVFPLHLRHRCRLE